MTILDEKSDEYSFLENIRFSYSGEQELGNTAFSMHIMDCEEVDTAHSLQLSSPRLNPKK